MATAVAPHMPRPGGRIVNISSIAAFTGGSRAGSTVYAAAKAGVPGLTYGLARVLSPQGITVNAIAPGFITSTGFTGDWSEERGRGIIEQTPVGRGGNSLPGLARSILRHRRSPQREWGMAVRPLRELYQTALAITTRCSSNPGPCTKRGCGQSVRAFPQRPACRPPRRLPVPDQSPGRRP